MAISLELEGNFEAILELYDLFYFGRYALMGFLVAGLSFEIYRQRNRTRL